jgi:hypothetical protein
MDKIRKMYQTSVRKLQGKILFRRVTLKSILNKRCESDSKWFRISSNGRFYRFHKKQGIS